MIFVARLVPVLILLLFFSVYPVSADAGENWVHEIRLGLLDHDTDHLWSGIKREAGCDFNAEVIFDADWDLWYGTLRPNLGISINDRHGTSKVYGGGVWQYEWAGGLFLDFGLGVSATDGVSEDLTRLDKKQLGSKFLIRVAMEIGFSFNHHHRLSLMFDHISNGYTAEANEGLDTIGIRYGYRF